MKTLLRGSAGLLLALQTGIAGAAQITIPAGPFAMGCSQGDRRCEKDEGPPGGVLVRVPEFRLDSHEVTVAEYRACITAGACARPKDHARNRYCNLDAAGRDDHPVNCVDWYAPDAPAALYAAGNLEGPPDGRQRVVRGGSWDESGANLRSSFRNVKPPQSGDAVYGSIGFRCASD